MRCRAPQLPLPLAGDLPLQSFEDLLENLASLASAKLRLETGPEHRVSMLSALTLVQERPFQLLGIKPHLAPPPEPMAATPRGPSH